jgi:hypothetical protein
MEFIVSLVITIIFVLILCFCLVRIFISIFAESKYRAVLSQNAPYNTIKDEPFAGSLYLCALLVYVYGSAYDADHEMRYTFNKSAFAKNRFGVKRGVAAAVESVSGRADWGPYCRAAESLHSVLNGDILIESLASVLSKNKLDTNLLTLVFAALTSSEMMWNEKERGTKPSVYLAQLLDYTIEDDSLSEAYQALGLKINASLEEVKSAHRKLVAQYHPDRVGTKKASDSTTAAEELEAFMKIQKAYELITSTKK